MIAINLANCFLALVGALLALFEWRAAKRREFLYLYMTFGKPDSAYFHSARVRRRQFTTILLAFLLLTAKEILANSILYNHAYPMALDWSPLTHSPSGILLIEMLVVGILAYAFLKGEQALPTRVKAFFLAYVIVVPVAYLILLVGHQLIAIFPWVYRVGLVACAAIAIGYRWGGTRDYRLAFSTAFGMLAVGAITDTMLYHRVATLSAYFLFDSLLLQNIIEQYEEIEVDRHRLERERQIVVTFLQAIGNTLGAEAFDLNQVLEMVMASSLRATNATAGAIFLIDSDGKLQAKLSRGFFPPMYDATEPEHRARRTEILQSRMLEQQFGVGEGIVGQVAKTGEPVLIEDVEKAGIMLGTTTGFMRSRSMILVPLTLQDEVLGVMGVLNKETATPFDTDDQYMLQALAENAALAIRNAEMVAELAVKERLDREVQIAQQIQKQLLPKRCPDLPGFELAALGTPAQEVGGDYYDFFWIDENRLGIVVADVSGKGIPAAMTMAIIRSIFRGQSTGDRTAKEVITSTNAIIYPDLRRGMFVTAFFGILDVKSKTLAWCRAGHEPMIAIHPGGAMEVRAPDGAALGIAEDVDFRAMIEENQMLFASGDTVVIYTDGITEAMNSAGEEFGLDRLKQTVRSNGCPDGEALVKKVESTVRSFVGSAPQHDDMTMVLVRAK